MTMYESYISTNRMAEDRAATDAAYRRTLEKKGRPLLSHGRAMSDEALLAKLHGLGLDADRERLLGSFSRFISAERMANAMIADASSPIPAAQTHWVWIALTCLWERWRPDLANTEMLDDKMQAGYAALADGETAKACRLWLEAWRAVLDIMPRSGTDSLDGFDDQIGGTQSVLNWVQDLETELHNAGLEEPDFFRERIALCETMIARFSGGWLPVESFQAALAQSHFELGDREEGDRLFRRWLDECPQWGGGWMAWSDGYWLFAGPRIKDAARAEQILQEGLAVPGVENRTDLLDRLARNLRGNRAGRRSDGPAPGDPAEAWPQADRDRKTRARRSADQTDLRLRRRRASAGAASEPGGIPQIRAAHIWRIA